MPAYLSKFNIEKKMKYVIHKNFITFSWVLLLLCKISDKSIFLPITLRQIFVCIDGVIKLDKIKKLKKISKKMLNNCYIKMLKFNKIMRLNSSVTSVPLIKPHESFLI